MTEDEINFFLKIKFGSISNATEAFKRAHPRYRFKRLTVEQAHRLLEEWIACGTPALVA